MSEKEQVFTLSEYQKQAITSKIYRDEVALPYVVLGLVGEAAEMKEKQIAILTNGFDSQLTNEFAKEVGDVAWYLAAIATETGQNLGDFDDGIDPEGVHYTFAPEVDRVVLHAGGIAEVLKKALRDDYAEFEKGSIVPEKLEKINVHIKKIVTNMKDVCYSLGLDFTLVLKQNIEKLQSRKERGVLSGSGDNR